MVIMRTINDEEYKDDDEEHLVMTGLKKQHITILNLLELKNQHRSKSGLSKLNKIMNHENEALSFAIP